jgi:carboxymethylenebutenolidase
MGERPRIPREAIELYDQYVHGDISRRAFMDGLKRYAVVGLTATAMAEALMPNYALGQQIQKDDDRIKASYETVPSPDGHGSIRGYFARPFAQDSRAETPTKLPGVIVIHENRGLNPHTEDIARRFALANFIAFAPDAVTSLGGYPGDDFRGGQMFGRLDGAKRTNDFVNAARWLKAHPLCTGMIAATGFCFGGGLSNALAGIMGPELAAAAPFYGGQTPAADVPKIKAAILIHHGALDRNLMMQWPAQEAALKQNNIRYEGHVYPESVHGFFNDATPERYNRAAAELAWTRTIAWFNQHTRPTPA